MAVLGGQGREIVFAVYAAAVVVLVCVLPLGMRKDRLQADRPAMQSTLYCHSILHSAGVYLLVLPGESHRNQGVHVVAAPAHYPPDLVNGSAQVRLAAAEGMGKLPAELAVVMHPNLAVGLTVLLAMEQSTAQWHSPCSAEMLSRY